MNFRTFFLFSFLLCITGDFLAAEEPGTTEPSNPVVLTVEKAVSLALAGNNSILRQKIALEASKRTADHAWNSASPSLSLSSNVTKPGNADVYDYSASFEGRLSVSLKPDIFSAMQKAQADYNGNCLMYNDTKRKVEGFVRTAFFTLLYDRENILLQQKHLETIRQQYEQNLRKYHTGTISELDVLSSKVAYEKRKPQVQAVCITYDNDMASFLQLVNLKQRIPVQLSGSLQKYIGSRSDIGTDKIKQQIETILNDGSAPVVMLAANKIKSATSDLNKNRWESFGPTVGAAYSYSPTITYKGSTRDSRNNGSLTFGVSIPLDSVLPWSQGADRIAAAKDTIHDLDLNLQDIKKTVTVQTDNYLRLINQKKESIQSQRENIKLADQTYRMARDAYDNGTKDLLALQTASDQLLEAQIALESGLLDFLKTCIACEELLGIPFGTLSANEGV